MDPYNSEIFYGGSYTLEAMIEFLARRFLRNTIGHFWQKITAVDFMSFHPGADWEWFRWKATTGSLDERTPNMPQSWAALLDVAQNGPEDVPELLRNQPPFALLYCLVFPHRFNAGLLRLIERSIRESK
jgi:hypothetical protein